MEVNGRIIHLRRTVGAEADISDLCPEGKIQNLPTYLFQQDVYSRRLKNTARFISALSRAGENVEKFKNPDYDPMPLTTEEVLSLDFDTFAKLQEEALAVFMADGKTTVEAASPKKRKAVMELK